MAQNVHVNKTRFKTEAKGNSEIAYCHMLSVWCFMSLQEHVASEWKLKIKKAIERTQHVLIISVRGTYRACFTWGKYRWFTGDILLTSFSRYDAVTFA